MKKLGVIIAFLGLSFGLQAQEQFTGSLLWKISGKNLKKPSYILGTHHAVPVSFIDSIAGFNRVFKQVKQVAGEVDMSNLESAAAILAKYSVLPEKYSYKSMLPNQDYQLLDNTLKELTGMGMDTFEKIHPAAIQIMITQLICAQVFPEFLKPDVEPIDGYVQKIARRQKKSVLGLETVEDQFNALFNYAPIEEQVKALVCFIRDKEEAVVELVEITQFYHQKQHNAIAQLYEEANGKDSSDENCQLSTAYMDGLNKNRNDNWLKILPEMMKNKPGLITVGAMHIAGKDGLLYKLHQMGYTVEAVAE